ncbi:MAG: hypothetical protein KF799_00140 [Bdellovibrionales bacterium]|nr:hypothetical protein [Bdellovibrionales bacterium]
MLLLHGMKKNAAFAVFANKQDVERAFLELNSEGFRPEEVAVILPDHDGDKDFAASDHLTRITQGAGIGAGIGLIAGLILGFLAGFGAIPLPTLIDLPLNALTGPFIGGIFGLIAGAASGTLVGIGTPASPTERYAKYLEDGGILVSVHAEEHARALRAMEILERNDGSDISEINENDGWNEVLTRTRSFRPVT